MNAGRSWHTLTREEALETLESRTGGLTDGEAARRLECHGPNELVAEGRVSGWSILLEQFKNVLIVILLIAVAISAFLGHPVESVAIGVIVAFAIGLGFIQEYRAERAIEALRKMAAPLATVLRGGAERSVAARELVPGDVVLLHAGDRIPADLRLLEAISLEVNESSLTGESVPVSKQTDKLGEGATALGDRTNLVYSGTDVTMGRGTGVVVATGMATEFGRITGLLQTVESGRTPLQENLDRVGKVLAVIAGLIVLLIVVLGLWRGEPLLKMFIFGVALAVAVVPEALPAVVTISLAIGVQRMVKRNALIRHLPTVETLGSTSIICSDKTGTLTRDEMTVRRLWCAGRALSVTGSGYVPEGRFEVEGEGIDLPAPFLRMLGGAALASDTRLEKVEDHWDITGDPTEGALVVVAAKAGLRKGDLDREQPRISEIPFTSERKRMTTVHEVGPGRVAYTKGAPEVVLDRCTSRLTDDGPAPLEASDLEEIRDTAREWAGEALRVLAVATRPDATGEDPETDLVFLGLAGMIDPPRAEAASAIGTCERAGIKPVMITGDHPRTAEAVARELRILDTGRVITGVELDAMDDDALEEAVQEIEVYARVSPEHKLRVVHAWKRHGHVVAMTGDGVNDAPALKTADIGIAMGITGTDVSKEAADMMLTDDNFASIVGAVEEGRAIFSNIKKYLMYLLSSNIGEIGLMAGATLAGWPLPLTAVQILYVNLATDGLPALALAVDPRERDLMERRPRDPRRGIFTLPVVVLMLVGGLWSTVVNLALFRWAMASGRGTSEAMTMTFVSLVLIQFFKAYNFRSDRQSVLVRPLANNWLNLAILWELALLAVVVYTPLLQEPFSTFGLTLRDWLIVASLSVTVVPVIELAKWGVRRGWFGTPN